MAVTAVKNAISKTDYLVESINENDKEPSWDGAIYVYDLPANNHKKEDYKSTVPVQVKGTVNNNHSNEKIKFRVEVVDLVNYRKVGGTIFFVVYVSSDGENTKIYYNPMLPFELNRILKDIGTKKSIMLEFCSFPTDKLEISNTVINFARDMGRQGLLRNGEYDLERAAKEFDLSKFQYGFSYTGLGYSPNNPMDYLLTHDLYLYAHNKDQTVNIVIDHIERAEIITTQLHKKVGSGGKIFYSTYILNYTRDGIEIQIGKSFKLKCNNDKMNLTYKLAGNLAEQITDIEFMLSVVQNQNMYVNDLTIPFNATEDEIAAFHVNEAMELLEHLKNVQEVMTLLGITDVLDVEKMTDKEDDYVKMIVRAFKDKQPITFKEENVPLVAPVNIANLKIIIAFKPTGNEREYELKNFFDSHLEMAAQTEDGEMIETSQYTILTEQIFLTASNLNLDTVVADLCSYHNAIHYERVNLCALQMIKAFDKSKSQSLLKAAVKVLSWLIGNDSNTDLYRVNLYQCILRQRKLTVDEKSHIYNLLQKYTGDNSMSAGLYILLGEKEEAEKKLQLLPADMKEAFEEYPIYNLIKS